MYIASVYISFVACVQKKKFSISQKKHSYYIYFWGMGNEDKVWLIWYNHLPSCEKTHSIFFVSKKSFIIFCFIITRAEDRFKVWLLHELQKKNCCMKTNNFFFVWRSRLFLFSLLCLVKCAVITCSCVHFFWWKKAGFYFCSDEFSDFFFLDGLVDYSTKRKKYFYVTFWRCAMHSLTCVLIY